MKLYFVRHGQTEANARNEPVSEPDAPLTPYGVAQIRETAERLKDVKFDAIISSPFKRAIQTTTIINKYHNLPVLIVDAWHEREAEKYFDAKNWHTSFDFDKNKDAIGDIEPLDEFFARIYDAIESMKKEYTDKTVLVVSHGGVQHAVYAYANKLPFTGNMRISPMNNGECRQYEL